MKKVFKIIFDLIIFAALTYVASIVLLNLNHATLAFLLAINFVYELKVSTEKSIEKEGVSETNDEVESESVKRIKEKFICPMPEGEPCDRHKINDDEGQWEFCNTCKREWER